MATVHVNVDLSTIDISSLFTYTNFSPPTDGTSFRVFDNANNYVEFTGTGLGVLTSGGAITGVTGTVTGITFVDHGATQLDVSGASVSAPDLLLLAFQGKTTEAIQLFLTGDDTIFGSGAGDLLHGYDGNDKIIGRGGADKLFGDIGNDVLIGNGGDDKLQGGGGNDVLKGGPGNDTMSGDAGNDILKGQGGDDILHGRAGADVLLGLAGDDILKGEAGNDKAIGGGGSDRILGGGGNDTLLGGNVSDYLLGGAGNDVLKGQAGSDFLTGNRGRDTFAFENLSDSRPGIGHDHINDFQQAQHDHISVHGIDADTTAAGNQDFSFIGTDPFSGQAGELRYSILANGHTIIAANVNDDKSADFTIELNSAVTLVGGDFFL